MTEWWLTPSKAEEKRPDPSQGQHLNQQDELELIKLIAISDPALDWPMEERCRRLRKNVMTAIAREPIPSSGFRLNKFF